MLGKATTEDEAPGKQNPGQEGAMNSRSRGVVLSLAVVGLGLAADGEGARESVSQSIGTDGPESALAASLMAGLAEIAGSASA